MLDPTPGDPSSPLVRVKNLAGTGAVADCERVIRRRRDYSRVKAHRHPRPPAPDLPLCLATKTQMPLEELAAVGVGIRRVARLLSQLINTLGYGFRAELQVRLGGGGAGPRVF